MRGRKLATAAALLALATSGLALAGPAINEGVSAPYLMPESRVSPEYPPAAFDARMEGQVTVAVLVLKDGSVAHVETLESTTPNLGFEAAVADAVQQWQFEPGQKDGKTIDAFSVVRLSFRRTGGAAPTGYVTAGFMPLSMLSASIEAEVVNPAGDLGGMTLASVPGDGGAKNHIGIPWQFYDPRSHWFPKSEAVLRTDYVELPDIQSGVKPE